MRKIVLPLLICLPFFAWGAHSTPHPTVEEFRQQLGIQLVSPNQLPNPDKVAHLYLVHHGSTDWTDIQRLQGWKDVPLNQKGKDQMEALARKLKDVSFEAIYSSSSKSAVQSGEILKTKLRDPMIILFELQGEYQGEFEGYTREQYEKQPHYRYYRSLSPGEEIFYPCGQGGESKADVACRVIPMLKEIAQEHIGDNVIVITHSGLFKLLNFYLGRFSHENGTMSIAPGSYMLIDADAKHLYLRNSD